MESIQQTEARAAKRAWVIQRNLNMMFTDLYFEMVQRGGDLYLLRHHLMSSAALYVVRGHRGVDLYNYAEKAS